MIIALSSLFLLPLLTACGHTETKYVPVQPVPLPANLTADCPVPEIPDPFTYGDSLDLNENLLLALENCNVDKARIREIEKNRQISTKEKP
ncbi:Rz1-like lysis system protein LysC [Kosakonia radicincitans]